MDADGVTPVIWQTIERYFRLLQAHVPAEQMRDEVLSVDFRTGFVDGLVWSGESGLQDFLAARSVFFDESHVLEQMSPPQRGPQERWQVRTRLSFFLRARKADAPLSQEFTGRAFHLWEVEPAEDVSAWRVAAQMVEGFADLNHNAERLFSAPDTGLTTQDEAERG
ncbi:hypothetical protein ACWGN5_14745 [Streptomyces sp. NPDC055815]